MIVHTESGPRKPERVVLIGGSGFIGRTLSRRLAERGVETVNIASGQIDLTQEASGALLTELLKPGDSVVMLAALTPDRGRDAATLARNVEMIRHVVHAASKVGCRHFVYFSSDAVYDPALSFVTDSSPAAPVDLYGVMHLVREIIARGMTSTKTLIFRPSIVYGAGDTHNSYGPNRFRRTARKEKKIALFGEGEETRDHVYVDDVAAVTELCLEWGSIGTVALATGRSVSFRQVAELVRSHFTEDIAITGSPRGNPVTHRSYDPTPLIKAFPLFRFVPIEEGIARAHAAAASADARD